jgi:hypothetical protein
MAKRVNDGVDLIKTTADTGRGGSTPKPPKAVARRASLEAPRSVSDHEKAKRRLTAKTVALSRRISPNDPSACSMPAPVSAFVASIESYSLVAAQYHRPKNPLAI